jgi:hypothetical protein
MSENVAKSKTVNTEGFFYNEKMSSVRNSSFLSGFSQNIQNEIMINILPLKQQQHSANQTI